jgi:flotillin
MLALFADPVDPIPVLIAVAIALILLGFVILVVKRYKRCPSNRILVIFGKVASGQSARCLHGGGAFVWPLIQDYAFLSLDPMQIEIPLRGALSAENIRVNVPSVFTVAIGTEAAVMQTAAIRLLGLDPRQIMKQAEDIILGQLRQVIASMTIEDINRNRDKFLDSVQNSLTPELEKIGLLLINVNITDITDESGYIEAMGRKAASEAIQSAEIDVAQQQKRGSIGVAEAKREQDVLVANADKVREIGTKEAEREKLVRLAELAKDAGIGRSRAELEQQSAIKDQERQMRVQVADAEAAAVTGENLARAKVVDAEAALKVRQAEAFQLAETAAKAIANVKFDKVVVWDGGAGNGGKNATAGFLQGLAGSLPPLLQMMKDIGGVEMPAYFGKLADGAAAPPAPTAAPATNAAAANAPAGRSQPPAPPTG